jgi:hypothetical protein
MRKPPTGECGDVIGGDSVPDRINRMAVPRSRRPKLLLAVWRDDLNHWHSDKYFSHARDYEPSGKGRKPLFRAALFKRAHYPMLI